MVEQFAIRGGTITFRDDSIEIEESIYNSIRQTYHQRKIIVIVLALRIVAMLASTIFNPDVLPRPIGVFALASLGVYFLLVITLSRLRSDVSTASTIPRDKLKHVELPLEVVLEVDVFVSYMKRTELN